jgi:hypothetical protein
MDEMDPNVVGRGTKNTCMSLPIGSIVARYRGGNSDEEFRARANKRFVVEGACLLGYRIVSRDISVSRVASVGGGCGLSR